MEICTPEDACTEDPLPRTLQELRARIATHGRTAAIIGYRGDSRESLSFAELVESSGWAAQGRRERGIESGACVALVAPNSSRWIAAFWAIIAAGGVAVLLDLQAREDDLARMMETAGCSAFLTVEATAERLGRLAPSCRAMVLDVPKRSSGDDSWEGLIKPRTEGPLPIRRPEDDAVIVFTLGTTGTPKAVPLTHANLLTNVAAIAATHLLGSGDRALRPSLLYHAHPLTIGMLTSLALGCGIIFAGGLSGPELLRVMRDGEATALVDVPGSTRRCSTTFTGRSRHSQARFLGYYQRFSPSRVGPSGVVGARPARSCFALCGARLPLTFGCS